MTHTNQWVSHAVATRPTLMGCWQSSLTSLRQTDLQGRTLYQKNNDDWGDYFNPTGPAESCWRIGFQNIGPQKANSQHPNALRTMAHIKQGQYDIFLMNKLGLRWGKIPLPHCWYQRTQNAFDRVSSVIGYNVHEHAIASPYQAGGTGIVITEAVIPRKDTQGKDPTGLGRWVWLRVTGKDQFAVRFIAAYRPVKNMLNHGSVWQQHARYLAKHNDH